ncbi:phosphoribosyltransferase [Rhodovulum sp. YNF3179]|uniref:phosphoribosyltransferase n=1 Tax=Rhodovulum sp. YNF3179 TaxID=3425127 RepID=UPI003D32EBD5
MTRFVDRADAAEALADRLAQMDLQDPVILALPRGGVPIGRVVADRLGAPLDLVMVRKIGVPGNPELAAAAVVNGAAPEIVVNESVMAMAHLDRAEIDRLAETQLDEIRRRRVLYLAGRAPLPVAGRTAVVVDDGIATGATVRAALKAVTRRKAARVVLAVPVAPPDTVARLEGAVDDLVCLTVPQAFWAVGQAYHRFEQVSDDEVVRLMGASAG